MNSKIPSRVAVIALAVAGTFAFAHAAAQEGGAPPAAAASGAPAGGPPAAPAPRPHAVVVKDAKEVPGLFKMFRKDEKVWLEIKPDQFNKPYYFTWNIPQSVGERGLYGSQMGGGRMVVWKKIGNQIQLIAKNTEFHAKPGTPQAQFVSESFSDSILTSGPAASLPHPESKGVLIDVSSFFFGDIPGYQTRVEAAMRLPYALDARNTSITRADNTTGQTGLQVTAHFALPKIPAPPLMPGAPAPRPAESSPDPRSFFVSFYYSFIELPAEPMRPRIADERVGHFVTSRVDYTDDISPKVRTPFVNRWRLEKKDPGAAVSEPKQPIVYWVDKNVPEKYRDAVTRGILEWNKAFEKAGFKNAIVVKQQTEKDDFDTMDAKHASVRWFTGADVGFAIGPSRVDPRTGEILDADIATGYGFTRNPRRIVMEDIGKAFGVNLASEYSHEHSMTCGHAWHTASDTEFAMDLLEARGEFGDAGWDSPEADALAKANLTRNVMHEVGHTLGFRHNFKGSAAYSLKQVQDPAFTKVNGVVASIMEYMPLNIAVQGEKQGEYVNSTLGPYDYWAVEYAYKELDPKTEKEELAKIAKRQETDPRLAYATDEDSGSGPFLGIDPDVNRFDLGSEPLEYYKKRMQLSRELWGRMENLKLKEGESYERYTRSFGAALQQMGTVASLAVKMVGGVTHRRDRAGSGKPTYEPVPVARQREALKLVAKDFFSADSFKIKPELVSRLGIDHLERIRGQGIRNPDFNIAGAILAVQREALEHLWSDEVAERLHASREKVSDGSKVLTVSELYGTLQGAIWGELATGADIPSSRRNLQREHLRRVANDLLRSTPNQTADTRAAKREAAVNLEANIRKAAANPKLSKEARAHLNESQNTLQLALKAELSRSGV
ncbi:MAG: zinc-dependent metalloprotease [Burkholderiales bacterium]|nr:zinc-dependent metalloprotease [Burkholderiales bacterium]